MVHRAHKEGVAVCRRLGRHPGAQGAARAALVVDDELLASEGITDLEKYSVVPGTKDFLLDFFLD